MNRAAHIHALVVLTLCAPVTLHAQTMQEEPSFEALDATTQQRLEELLDLITEATEQERYDSALSYLDEAQQLFDHPEFWLDRARILEAQGKYQEAAGWIRRFTQVRPDSPRTTTLSRRAQALANTPDRPPRTSASGSLRITSSPPGAKVSFKDQSALLKGSTPTIAVPVQRPKTFVVQVSKTGYIATEESITVKPGEAKILHVDLERDPDAQQTMTLAELDHPAQQGRGAGPWVLWGIGAAGFTGVFLSSRWSQDLNARDARGEPVAQEQRRARNLFALSTVIAFTGTIGGTLMWLLHEPESDTPRAAISLTPTSTSVQIQF